MDKIIIAILERIEKLKFLFPTFALSSIFIIITHKPNAFWEHYNDEIFLIAIVTVFATCITLITPKLYFFWKEINHIKNHLASLNIGERTVIYFCLSNNFQSILMRRHSGIFDHLVQKGLVAVLKIDYHDYYSVSIKSNCWKYLKKKKKSSDFINDKEMKDDKVKAILNSLAQYNSKKESD